MSALEIKFDPDSMTFDKGNNESPLIPLNSEEGQRMLQEITETQYYVKPLHQIFAKQIGRSNCGIQSSALILNAAYLGKQSNNQELPHSEANLLERTEVVTITGREADIVAKGITLQQLHDLLLAMKYDDVISTKADQSSVDNFRRDCIASFTVPKYQSNIIINYNMNILGQGDKWGGHHTPLGGYHEPTDRLLILDVWPHTESCWATVKDVYTAMNTVDSASGLKRGYCIAKNSS